MESISIFLITTNIVFIIAIAALSLRLHMTAKALAYCHRQKQRQDIKSATIIESLPVGVEVYSHNGVLLSINNRDCEIFGVKKEDILVVTSLFKTTRIFRKKFRKHFVKEKDHTLIFHMTLKP